MIETPLHTSKILRGIIPTILVRVVCNINVYVYVSKMNECVARIVFREKSPHKKC